MTALWILECRTLYIRLEMFIIVRIVHDLMLSLKSSLKKYVHMYSFKKRKIHVKLIHKASASRYKVEWSGLYDLETIHNSKQGQETKKFAIRCLHD